MRRRGFTLIEVLVVVAIIALLVAVLIPSLARARAVSQRTVCLHNLKMLGQAWMLYYGDNKGALIYGHTTPDPALDPLWISAWEPFKGAQKKEFGFQVTVKVSATPEDDNGDKKDNGPKKEGQDKAEKNKG